MGETGCGKTRLIRFMCDLAAQGSGKGNMMIMKAGCACTVYTHVGVHIQACTLGEFRGFDPHSS